MRLNDKPHRRETESRAFVGLLGGEERLPDPGRHLQGIPVPVSSTCSTTHAPGLAASISWAGAKPLTVKNHTAVKKFSRAIPPAVRPTAQACSATLLDQQGNGLAALRNTRAAFTGLTHGKFCHAPLPAIDELTLLAGLSPELHAEKPEEDTASATPSAKIPASSASRIS